MTKKCEKAGKLQNMEKNKVAFLTLGCKVNSYETDAMEKQFKEAGYTVVSFGEVADVYVINTCSVTNMADRKSRQMISKAKKNNPDAIIVATGCYVQTASEDMVKNELKIDIAVGNNKKGSVLEAVNSYLLSGNRQINIIDINEKCEYEDTPISETLENTRAYIKIQDGCNQFCSYCIIPYARGRIRSRDRESIINEVKTLVRNGYKEVVVTGIHLSSYGLDFKEDTYEMTDYCPFKYEHLLNILQEINDIDGLERIRLGSLEPRIITEEFLNGLSKLTKLCPHFHLSLQSGCDETLKRMNRKYNGEKYMESLALLRKYYDNPAITTDVIVGFPKETDEEFNITRKFLEECKFSMMHIFKYSRRKGTVADRMPMQVDEGVKTQRSHELLELSNSMNKEYCKYYIGQTAEVLFEEVVKYMNEDYYCGHTTNYIKVLVPVNNSISKDSIRNQIQKVVMSELVDENTLLGEICI